MTDFSSDLITESSEVQLGIVRGISYGLFKPPDPFVPQLRDLGATLLRVFLYWSQIEPEPGRYSFEVVDSLLSQLDGSEQVWVTICSSSRWATREATDFLPPSPAKDQAVYREFVQRLVAHCGGRVRYWQCDNEPCNLGLTWSGSAAEYVVQLRGMYRAVKQADPRAVVVLGGAPYALPASPSDSAEWQFFDELLRDGRDCFDAFDLHVYGASERIVGDIGVVRGWMRAHGYEKPVLIGEYGAPIPDQFPAAQAAIQHAMTQAFGAVPASSSDGGVRPPPDRVAVASLYERRATLPPELQMFLAGCPPELDEKRHRIHCRAIVLHNLLALSAGVRVTACWKLAPEVAEYEDPLSIMELFYGKLSLLHYEGRQISQRLPPAKTFALLAERLGQVRSVRKVQAQAQPELQIFEVQRLARGPLLVVWNQAEPFTGEDQPPVVFVWPWAGVRAGAVDALGTELVVDIQGGQLSLEVSVTPVFIAAD